MNPIKRTEINKALIRDVYRKIIGERDTALVHKIIAEDYIQHNPMVKTGRSGLLEALEMLKKFPKAESNHKPFTRMFAQDDYVVLHMLVEIFGSKKLVVELFRIEGGMIAEHWDAIEDIAFDTGVNGNTVIGGPVEITDIHLTATNKSLVADYCATVVAGRRYEKITGYVLQDLIQHHPQLENGIEALAVHLQTFSLENVVRIISEGNFVLTQSKGMINSSPHVFYDIYRIETGKIAEHWSVKQIIPDVMAHGSGMI